jgi:hypothetical protein
MVLFPRKRFLKAYLSDESSINESKLSNLYVKLTGKPPYSTPSTIGWAQTMLKTMQSPPHHQYHHS